MEGTTATYPDSARGSGDDEVWKLAVDVGSRMLSVYALVVPINLVSSELLRRSMGEEGKEYDPELIEKKFNSSVLESAQRNGPYLDIDVLAAGLEYALELRRIQGEIVTENHETEDPAVRLEGLRQRLTDLVKPEDKVIEALNQAVEKVDWNKFAEDVWQEMPAQTS